MAEVPPEGVELFLRQFPAMKLYCKKPVEHGVPADRLAGGDEVLSTYCPRCLWGGRSAATGMW
jgi:hypothetical protein